MKMIAMCSQEWFPFIDIREIEDSLDASPYERITRISEDDFYVYKGLLTQMERLQDKLGKIYKGAKK